MLQKESAIFVVVRRHRLEVQADVSKRLESQRDSTWSNIDIETYVHQSSVISLCFARIFQFIPSVVGMTVDERKLL